MYRLTVTSFKQSKRLQTSHSEYEVGLATLPHQSMRQRWFWTSVTRSLKLIEFQDIVRLHINLYILVLNWEELALPSPRQEFICQEKVFRSFNIFSPVDVSLSEICEISIVSTVLTNCKLLLQAQAHYKLLFFFCFLFSLSKRCYLRIMINGKLCTFVELLMVFLLLQKATSFTVACSAKPKGSRMQHPQTQSLSLYW